MKTLLVKRSTAGLGLYANSPFKKGELVIEYTGERITADEGNRRGGKYLFELNDQWMIDGKGREHTARYINHSCRPNAYPELSEDETQVHIYAKRNIKIGEEITYHYGKQYFKMLIEPAGCRCSKCATKLTQ